MAKKPPRDDPKQSERFIKAAKEAEANEDPKAMERALKAVVSAKAPRRS